jgi:hypothetical protein
MADSTGLFIVLIIFCILSIITSTLFTYTCTDGTWDFDNFEGGKCVKWPGGDDDGGSGGGGGGGGGSDPSDQIVDDNVLLGRADNYSECYDGISINESKTSFSANDNSAGVRWFWSEADRFSGCQGSITKYRVKISSSLDNHLQQYYYDVLSGFANSFAFKNAPEGWLSGQNIKFKITALTHGDLVVADTVTVELDANESTDDGSLVGVGTPIEFTNMTKVEGGDPPPPPPDPVNCSGGTWTNVGGCMLDGVEVDPDECGEPCIQKQVLSGADFIPASDGGTCITEKYSAITRKSCEEFELGEQQDCSLGPWTDVILEGGSACTRTCGGGTMEQRRAVLLPASHGGKACGDTTQILQCNTQDCPVHCVGNWSCGSEYIETVMKPGADAGGVKYASKDCTYVVTRDANPYGNPCPYANDAKTKRSTIVCVKGAGKRKKWKKGSSTIGSENCPSEYS